MNATFNFIGMIKDGKGTSDETEQIKGGTKRKLKFMMMCDGNAQFLELSAVKWNSDSGVIKTWTRGDGTKKSERIDVKYEDRFKPEILETIRGDKIYVVDPVTPQARKEAQEKGETVAKREEYLLDTDFIEALAKFVKKASESEMKVQITGNVDINYSVKDDRYYRTFVPLKVVAANENRAENCTETIDFHYTGESINKDSDKFEVNGYFPFYFRQFKRNYFTPITLHAKNEEEGEKYAKLFSSPDANEVKHISLEVKLINGSQRREITEDDLTDEQKDLIEMGLTTFDEVKRSYGGYGFIRGERKTDIIIEHISRSGLNMKQDTILTVDDLKKKPVLDDIGFNLFGDGEDII